MKKAAIFLTLLLALATVIEAQGAQRQNRMQCIAGVMATKMGDIASDPIGVILAFNACAGDDTWDYLAPFLGGVVRPFAHYIYDGWTDGSEIMTELELYNKIMAMVKQAVGEVLGYIENGGFKYINSLQ